MMRAMLVFAALTLSAAVVHAQKTTGGIDHCVVLSYNDQGILFVGNSCNAPIRAMWFFGQGNQGSWTLQPNEKTTTGADRGDIARRGAFKYYACPLDIPKFRDDYGRGITSPVVSYHCATD